MRSDNGLSYDDLADRLPPAPPPQGGYVPAVVFGPAADGRAIGLVMTAGMTPRIGGVLRHRGQLGRDLEVEEGIAAAAIAADNALAAALAALTPDQQLDRVLRLVVYVNAVSAFDQHTKVADGASARLRELLGDGGGAARAAIGVGSLPGGACVEVELTCAWRAKKQ